MKCFLAIVALIAAHVSAFAQACERPPEILISSVNVIDVEQGKVRRNRGLLLSDGIVAAEFDSRQLRKQARRHPSATRIDAKGGYAIPGLWDMHVHTLWDSTVVEPFFARFLAEGVTAVRDMGGDLAVAQDARRRIARCELQAPRLWFPGPFLDGPKPVDPSLSLALATPEEGRAAVRRLAAEKVNFIKVYSLLPVEVLDAVIEEARKLRLDVVGHVPAYSGVVDAAFELRSIEHLAIEVGGLCPAENRQACEPVFRKVIERNVAQVPTLAVRETSTAMAEPGFLEPVGIDSYPVSVTRYWREMRQRTAAQATAEWREKRSISGAHAGWMTSELSARGAMILAGSDAGNPYVEPGKSLHDELELLVRSGLTPRAALAAATIDPARVMGVAKGGTILKGSAADLVLLRANPLDSIANTRSIITVIRDGRVVRRPN